MKSGSLASFHEAAPLEVYPGEPDFDECIHGWPGDEHCPYCDLDRANEDYWHLEQDCVEAENRADRLAVIADALASELLGTQ